MKKIITSFSILFFSVSNIYADLIAEVTKGIIQKPLISLISNNIVDKFPQDVNSIIVVDLNHNAKLQGSNIIKYGIKKSQDIPWSKINGEYVVLTKYIKNSYNTYTVKVKIFKKNNTSYMYAVTYKNINVSLVRTLAHKISNYIYKNITDENGFFLTKIAYVKVSNPYARYGRIYELIISDYDGFNKNIILKQIDNPIATPSWSSNGKYIVYSSYNEGNMGVYNIQIATGKVNLLTSFKGINSSPSFSPDDTKIALALSKGYSDKTNIYVMDLETKELKILTKNGINTAPRFSPNGKKIVFTSNIDTGRPNIYIANSHSQYLQYSILSNRIYEGYEPNYTPNGKNIVFMYKSSPSSLIQIAVFNLTNSNINTLTKGSSSSSPTISPYGNMIAYISTNSKGYNYLKIISLDGSKEFSINIENNENTLIQSPIWSTQNY